MAGIAQYRKRLSMGVYSSLSFNFLEVNVISKVISHDHHADLQRDVQEYLQVAVQNSHFFFMRTVDLCLSKLGVWILFAKR